MKISEIVDLDETELDEMATPRQSDLGKKYYHGTNDRGIQGIISNGIQPPDLTTRKGNFKPVQGKVYITPQLRYAINYAIGGDVLGHMIGKDYNNDYGSAGRYGYLCIIDGKQLDDIQPDEDSIGEMIHNRKIGWLHSLAKKYLSDSTYKKVMWGEYAYWARAGKQLVKRLSDSEKLALIDAGAHIANQGSLMPAEIWKFDKALNKDLKKDGSNFFELATRIQ